MAQNTLSDAVDSIKRNWGNFQKTLGGKKEEAPKDYFAHDWKPPAARATDPKRQTPAAKPAARKSSGKRSSK